MLATQVLKMTNIMKTVLVPPPISVPPSTLLHPWKSSRNKENSKSESEACGSSMAYKVYWPLSAALRVLPSVYGRGRRLQNVHKLDKTNPNVLDLRHVIWNFSFRFFFLT